MQCDFEYHINGQPVGGEDEIVAAIDKLGLNIDVSTVDGFEIYFRDTGVSVQLTSFGYPGFGCIMNSHTCVNGGTCNPYAYYGLTGTPDGNPHNEWRATNPDWLISDGE